MFAASQLKFDLKIKNHWFKATEGKKTLIFPVFQFLHEKRKHLMLLLFNFACISNREHFLLTLKKFCFLIHTIYTFCNLLLNKKCFCFLLIRKSKPEV